MKTPVNRTFGKAAALLAAAVLLTAVCMVPGGTAAAAGTAKAGKTVNTAGTVNSVQKAGTPYAAHGKLTVKGAALLDSRGTAFRLKGISTHGIAWYPQYVNEDAFRSLRDGWGVNVIRLAMYTEEYGGYCSGGDRKQLEKTIDKGVKACTDLGIYVIIDWHILSDGNPVQNQADAADFFARMSKKYGSCGNVLYEICNEPNGGADWKTVKKYAEGMIPVIRANAPDAVVLVGTPTWSQDVDQAAADPITDQTNIMYSFHFYAATHKDDLRKKLEGAVKAGLPVFVSEFSICDASGNGAVDYTSAAKWAALIRKYDLSTVGWNLSNKAEASALLQPSCRKTSGWTESDLTETGKWQLDFIRDN
jgi:aryl-phospho-beta-D-glucosidase BglC (GH1 family)